MKCALIPFFCALALALSGCFSVPVSTKTVQAELSSALAQDAWNPLVGHDVHIE
jgi:starvation-inducible outer membrane lipoprotein